MSNRDYGKLSDARLADAVGALDRELRSLGEARELAKAEVKRRGSAAIEGRMFVVTCTMGASVSWQTEKLEAELGPRAEQFRTRTRFLQVRSSVRRAEV